MGQSIVHSSNGFYSASGQYLGYPIYRSHTSLSDAITNPYSSHGVPYYRIHQVPGGPEESDIKERRYVMENSYGFSRDQTISKPENHTDWTNDKLLNFDEKKTMQSLNSRLASYLENVKKLEEENVILEKKICEWYEKNDGKVHRDFSPYLQIITDLQHQILLVTEHIANLVKQISDDHIVADDFRKKQAMDFQIRTETEKDLHDLAGILETNNMEKQNLSAHIQYLEEELLQLKKQSEQEIICLQGQLGTRVDVEVEMAPSIDLKKALSDIRKEYENHMETNLSDIESRFHGMTFEMKNILFDGMEQLQQFSNVAIDLKLQTKTLETELSKQMSMVSLYDSSLMEINEYYSSQLNHLQDMIVMTENQAEEIRSKFKQISNGYEIYENLKICLEKEIAAYKKLLEGQTTEYPFLTVKNHEPQQHPLIFQISHQRLPYWWSKSF
ncbi:keratin, type I cytoskeletal 19-like [Pyxicephalus adspersus]|uniref:keratin, type I cytoskeletal 19-like n=1 Tax=Pyxicephalus adspersus TaxID=30357 RepID=UPI003B5A8F2A